MSNLSDYLVKSLPGVSKSDANTLLLSAALPEIDAIATDTTVTGAAAGAIRLRNVRQANGAGPNIYFEGTNNASVVKQLARIQAAWIDVTSASEDSKLALTVIAAGVNSSIEMRADAALTFGPAAIAGFGLGTALLPWGDIFLGNAAGTRSIKLTSTGPGTDNALVVEATGALAVYSGAVLVGSFSSPSGSLKRLKSDFTHATVTNRLMFQTSTTNGVTIVSTLPDGTGTSSGSVAYAGSDPVNTNWFAITASQTVVTLDSGKTGTGTTQEIEFRIDGTRSLQISQVGDVVAGKTGLATGGTAGHLYIPAVAGVMTGVPAAHAGFVPIVFDTTNNKISVYDGGWIHSAALA